MSRVRSSRATRAASGAPAQVSIPNKLYFRIGDVSELTQTKAYVLRYWETEFPMLKPIKSKSGHRLYRRQDLEMVLEIKRLLYDKGYTIEGARKQLSNHSRQPSDQKNLFTPALDAAELKAIRNELQGVLTILSRKC